MGSPPFVQLPRIPVRVGPRREDAALAPKVVDKDTVLLRARVPDGTQAPIGVNVDGLLLIDAHQDGTVFDVEVLVPLSAWRSAEFALTPPASPEQGSIVVADPGPEIFVDRLTPRFTIDAERRLHVEVEVADRETRWVALSPGCFALLNGGFLAGFVALLPRGG